MKTVRINGQPVRTAKRVSWDPRDAIEFRTGRIIGRARIELEDGAIVHVPLFASTNEKTLGDRYVLFYDQETTTFIEVPFEPTESLS